MKEGSSPLGETESVQLVGPIVPATEQGLCGSASVTSAAACLASSAPSSQIVDDWRHLVLTLRDRRTIECVVSQISEPAAKCSLGMSLIMSGLLQISKSCCLPGILAHSGIDFIEILEALTIEVWFLQLFCLDPSAHATILGTA